MSIEEQKKYKWSFSGLPITPDNYLYKVNAATAKQFNVIKKLYTAKDIDRIYYAGDSGREGIYIQALIRNQIFKTAPKCDERVVWIDSFTDEAIKKGIREAKPYSEYKNMIDSGYERAIRDWLIGMNGTEALTLANGSLVNIGRVMTPTLAMIVARQEEIDNFKPTDYFGIDAVTDISTAKWKAVKGSRFFENGLLYSEVGFKDKKDADSLIADLNKDKTLTISDGTKLADNVAFSGSTGKDTKTTLNIGSDIKVSNIDKFDTVNAEDAVVTATGKISGVSGRAHLVVYNAYLIMIL